MRRREKCRGNSSAQAGAILCLTVHVLLAGCLAINKVAPVIRQDPVKIEKPADSFVIVGLRLPDVGSTFTAMDLRLSVNGDLQPPKGAVKPGVYGEKVGFYTGPNNYADLLTYMEVDRSGRAFRIWKIPGYYFAEGEPVRIFAFVERVRDNVGIWGPFRKNTPLPIDYQQKAAWWFDGLATQVTAPGVYYLGDVQVAGSILENSSTTTSHGNFSVVEQTIVSAFATTILSDPMAAHYFFAWQSGLAAFTFLDLSRAWRKLPGADYENYLWGWDAKAGWIPVQAPAPPSGASGQRPLAPPPAPR